MADFNFNSKPTTDNTESFSFFPKEKKGEPTKKSDGVDLKAAATGFAHTIVPETVGLRTAAVGAEVGGSIGSLPGMVAGGVVGYVLGSYLTSSAQDTVLPEKVTKYVKLMEEDHPHSYALGEASTNALFFNPVKGGINLLGRATMGSINAAVSLTSDKLQGKDIDWTDVGIQAGSGFLFNTPNKVGDRLSRSLIHKESLSKENLSNHDPLDPSREYTTHTPGEVIGHGYRHKDTGETHHTVTPHDFPEQSTDPNYEKGYVLKTKDGLTFSNFPHPDELKIFKQIQKAKLVSEDKLPSKNDTTLPVATEDNVSGNLLKYMGKVNSIERYTNNIKQDLEELATEPERKFTSRVVENVNPTRDRFYTNSVEKSKYIADTNNVINKLKAKVQKNPDHPDTEELRKTIGYIQQHLDNRKAMDDVRAESYKNRVVSLLNNIGETAKNHGVIQGMKDNYIPHMINWKDSTLSQTEKNALVAKVMKNLTPETTSVPKQKSDFTLKRQYETLAEFRKAFDLAKQGNPALEHAYVETDSATLVAANYRSLNTAMAKKHLHSYLKENGIVSEDINKVSDGWIMYKGKSAGDFNNLLINPDYSYIIDHLMEQKDPSLIVQGMMNVSALAKVTNTMGSLFHATSLTVARLVNDPIGGVKEITSGFKGLRSSFDLLKKGGTPEQEKILDTLITHGNLMVSTEDVHLQILPEIAKSVNRTLDAVGFSKVGSLLERGVSKVQKEALDRLNKITWDWFHAGQKVQVAMNLYAKIKTANPHLPDEVVAREVGIHVNRTFGGLNWLQTASSVNNRALRSTVIGGTGISQRNYHQIGFFAPDWTVSTFNSIADGFKARYPSLKAAKDRILHPVNNHDLAVRYGVTTALLYATLMNGANYAISGHSVWDNHNKTRIELGDGTEIQPAKHSMEFLEWIFDPEKTFSNKLGVMPKVLVIGTLGIAYPSMNAPRIPDRSLAGRLKFMGMEFMPFQANAAINAPAGSASQRALASFLGTPIYGKPREANMDMEKRIARRALLKEHRRAAKLKRFKKEHESVNN